MEGGQLRTRIPPPLAQPFPRPRMDIFFCDSCGARVTGGDLSRGHGIRKGAVVICGACIESGAGNQILGQAPAAVPAAAPQSLASAVTGRMQTPVAPPAKDRDEDDDLIELAEDPLTPARGMPAVPPPAADRPSTRRATPGPKSEDATALSGLGGGLSALSATPSEGLAQPAVIPVMPSAPVAKPVSSRRLAVTSSAAATGKGRRSDTDPLPAQAFVETEDIPVEEGDAPPPSAAASGGHPMPRPASAARRPSDRSGSRSARPGSGRQAAAGRGNTRASSRGPERGGNTRGSSRQNPRGSGRGPARKNNNTMIFAVSGVSLALLIIITVVIANQPKAKANEQAPVATGALSNQALESRISAVIRRVGPAVSGNSISEIDSVLADIRSCMDEVNSFCNNNGGGSSSRVSSWQDRAGVQQMNSSIRTLNDRKSILQSQGR